MITRKSQQVDEMREKMRGGEGHATLTELVGGQLPESLQLFKKITIGKGSSIGYHMHEGETELFYVLQGTAKMRDDDQEATLTVGDVLVTPSGHSHSVQNVGEDEVVLLAVIVKG